MMRLFFLMLPLLIGCAGGQKIVGDNNSNPPQAVNPPVEASPFSITLGVFFFAIVMACVYYLLREKKSESSD